MIYVIIGVAILGIVYHLVKTNRVSFHTGIICSTVGCSALLPIVYGQLTLSVPYLCIALMVGTVMFVEYINVLYRAR